MQTIRRMLVANTPALDVDREVFHRYNAELDDALSHCIWSHKGMTTYYRNGAGRIVVSSPWKYVDYWQRLREFDPDDYHEVNAQSETAEFAV
jgi:4-hydroxyacetophenone monooxygenase